MNDVVVVGVSNSISINMDGTIGMGFGHSEAIMFACWFICVTLRLEFCIIVGYRRLSRDFCYLEYGELVILY